MSEYSRVCPTCGEGYNVSMCDLCHIATVPAAIQEPAGSGARPPAEGISAEEWREYNDKVAASRRQK